MKPLRWIPLALAILALAGPGAGPLRAQGSVPGDSGIAVPPITQAPWRLLNPNPCQGDSVVFVILGYHATPCDSFVGAEVDASGQFIVRHRYRSDLRCFAPPLEFYPILFPLGILSQGTHALDIEVIDESVDASGSGTQSVHHETFSFEVSPPCVPPVPVPGGLPFVTSILTDPAAPCVGRSTRLIIEGQFGSSCGKVLAANFLDAGHVALTLQTDAPAGRACGMIVRSWKQEFDLGLLEAGPKHVEIRVAVVDSESAVAQPPSVNQDSTNPGRLGTYVSVFNYSVSENCDSAPPPPVPGPVVDEVVIGGADSCNSAGGGVCPGDSLRIRLAGRVFNTCTVLRRIDLLPDLSASPLPHPRAIRLVFGDGCCLCERPCALAVQPWSGSTAEGPLPPGAYTLGVEVDVQACGSDSLVAVGHVETPFVVRDSCPGAVACLVGRFPHAASIGGTCDAVVAPGRPATPLFNVRSAAALSGLQGRFHLVPSGLHIAGLEAVGSAAGMHLSWNATADGVQFVMFAEHGAPIPASARDGVGVPVIRVTVEQPAGARPTATSLLTASDLLGSDSAGRGVPTCSPPPCIQALVDLAYDPARICAELPCDFNGDGVTDVRDLVRMVHCINGEGPCPDSTAGRFDCDNNGVFDLSDVICCALNLLSEGDCATCPPQSDSSTARPEPSVHVTFGAPAGTGTGVDVPVRLAGVDRLGAAQLTLSFPDDRYNVVGVDLEDAASWMRLFQSQAGQLKIGLIRVSPTTASGSAAGTLSLTLHLVLKNGSVPGGEIAAESGQFSGPDGVKLSVDLGRPMTPLGAAAHLSLSPARPNPFSSAAQFTVTLDRPGQASVEIYDIRGRHVISLFDGTLSAGPHDFTWNGRRQGGALAAGGMYFYRVTSNGQSLARKLALLRSN